MSYYRRANFLNPDIFVWKFKRQPKMWTINQLHELYIKAKDRYDSRYGALMETLDKIALLEPNSKGKRITPYTQIVKREKKDEKGNIIGITWETYHRQYEFSESSYYTGDKMSLGWSHGDPKDDLNNRESRLDFLTLGHQHKLAEELGQEFFERQQLSDGARNSKYRVAEILWSEVERKLCEEYKGKALSGSMPPKISVVKIQGIEYYFECDSEYRGSYLKFKCIETKRNKVFEF